MIRNVRPLSLLNDNEVTKAALALYFIRILLEFKIKITTITVIEKKKIIMYNTSIEN